MKKDYYETLTDYGDRISNAVDGYYGYYFNIPRNQALKILEVGVLLMIAEAIEGKINWETKDGEK